MADLTLEDLAILNQAAKEAQAVGIRPPAFGQAKSPWQGSVPTPTPTPIPAPIPKIPQRVPNSWAPAPDEISINAKKYNWPANYEAEIRRRKGSLPGTYASSPTKQLPNAYENFADKSANIKP